MILWEGGQVRFRRDEVENVSRGEIIPGNIKLEFAEDEKTAEGVWNYQNDIVIKLTNREILDAKVVSVAPDRVTIRHSLESGGSIEQEIERSKIDSLVFKPILNAETEAAKAKLQKLFPQMKFYDEGNFTLFTDSYLTWVKEYKGILRHLNTEFYFRFFGLVKERHPARQSFVVVFDDWVKFVEYAVADGVPGWAVLGYFKPDDKVLYMFNTLGDRFSDFISEAIVGQVEEVINQAVGEVSRGVDQRYEVFIEGQGNTIKDKFRRAHSEIAGEFRNMTNSTLRHEFTHALFHNWGLQNISISKTKGDDRKHLTEEKKKFLETKDIAKKRQILRQLLSLRAREEELPLEAANSWFVEGLASYCETDPCGEENDNWLFVFQEMMKKGRVYPLEQLTVYRIGSFPGVYAEAMLDAYAQSWAFVTFLMHRYPEEFMNYQMKMAKETPKGNEDFQWLLEALGKQDARTLQEEFIAYMKEYQELEDPFLEQIDKMTEIFTSF